MTLERSAEGAGGGPLVFALSDVHADHGENLAWLRALPAPAGAGAALILAGDVADDLGLLGEVLRCLRDKFSALFFVPGNHDLWVRRGECPDSARKFDRVMSLAEALGVHTRPARVGGAPGGSVWIVPLLSWYVGPDEDEESLFVVKPGEDASLEMWSDRYFVRWPPLPASTPARYFLDMNAPYLGRSWDAPVISFSHFLPRRDLIFSTPAERAALPSVPVDEHPEFNFSRVAGCAGLDGQIRRLGAAVHVYGHQHRDRDRRVDGVRYVSCCLGYPRERARRALGPRPEPPVLVWGGAGSPASGTT
jgi:hypothetical protein